MSFFSELASLAASAAAIAIVAVPPAMALGIVPRVGPGRAMSLFLRSKFSRQTPRSLRFSDVEYIRNKVLRPTSDKRHNYIVVLGTKGVGKTTLVGTALEGLGGVVSVRVSAGELEKDIRNACFAEIASLRSSLTLANPESDARRVCWWFSMIVRRQPIIRIEASERQIGTPYAQITAAAKGLAALGYSVVVDGSENSIEPETIKTLREQVIRLQPLSREQLETIRELREVLDLLQKLKLKEVAYQVFGGVPAAYLNILEMLGDSFEMEDPAAIDAYKLKVEQVISGCLAYAVSEVHELRTKYPDFIPVLNKLQTQECVSRYEVTVTSEPSPNEVLHKFLGKINGENKWVYAPINPATGLVLRKAWFKMPSISELRDMFEIPKATAQAAPQDSPSNTKSS